jgi:hypothetical protein
VNAAPDDLRHRRHVLFLPVALISTAGEAWHAYTHLQLSTHSGPIAGMTAIFGLVVVVTAIWLDGRRAQGRAAAHIDERRAA